MCQLLGMNCNVPTDIVFSFTGFQARGGLTDNHTDGWGIAFFEGRGVRQFLDHAPSAKSVVADIVKNYPIKSTNVISHIRKATRGEVSLENTHPFARELWGYYWIFAHNGNLHGYHPDFDGPYRPVGTTDSEAFFCTLLQELRRTFGDKFPPMDDLFQFIHDFTLARAHHGTLNFLLSNGKFLIAHCSTDLSYIIRQAPFSEARLKDQDLSIDFSTVTTDADRVAVIATTPLTDNEIWVRVEPGSLCLFEEGMMVREMKTVAGKKDQSC